MRGRRYYEISGRSIDIDAAHDRAKICLREEERIDTGIRAEREIAERMATHLYRPVRAFGDAVWVRSVEVFWDLKKFEVVDFIPLEEIGIVEVFERIRKINGMEWREFDDPQAEFHALWHDQWPVGTGKGVSRSQLVRWWGSYVDTG